MLSQNEPTSVEPSAAAIVGTAAVEQLLEKNTVVNEISKVTAQEWFSLGNRVPRAQEIG